MSHKLFEKTEIINLPTEYGDFGMVVYRDLTSGEEHFALIKGGEFDDSEGVLVRLHSSCATGDILGSKRCDCGHQLHETMKMIAQVGRGAIVYLNQEGRGIGLFNKIKAYRLQEQGYDTVEANVCLGFAPDERDYGFASEMLKDLGLRKVKLITNNPSKKESLESLGIEVVETVGLEVGLNECNLSYMKTKKDKMGHDLKGV